MFLEDSFGGEPLIFQIFFFGIFFVIFGFIIFAIGSGILIWVRNNNSPVLVERVRVLSKRTKVSGGRETSARTSYYVTFGLEGSGERVELQVSGEESGIIIEGDKGDLTHQGTRYQGFHRVSE
ncbi:DUF2500 domain-containing protein [Bacillus sp. DJP31]|uniref:DUF2500 domain-containing protein n=1 Tax=Bacillus sp. DJP31 TaxID=3409789 RepID=UPI003BB497A3